MCVRARSCVCVCVKFYNIIPYKIFFHINRYKLYTLLTCICFLRLFHKHQLDHSLFMVDLYGSHPNKLIKDNYLECNRHLRFWWNLKVYSTRFCTKRKNL